MHADRGEAAAREMAGEATVVGVELFGRSDTYEWTPAASAAFRKITVFEEGRLSRTGNLAIAWGLVRTLWRLDAGHVFICNYNKPGLFLAALVLRLLGRAVYVMGCSKFDDYYRGRWRELAKGFFLAPYQAAISSGIRSRDYMRFLGIPAERVHGEYNTLSLDRIRALAGSPPAPDGTAFADRHFSIVARLVAKKNIAMALDAFAIYRGSVAAPRELHIYGSGPLQDRLSRQAETLGLSALVRFHGFQQTDAISEALGRTLALILPSIEEQFGNVVIEASALGVPTILSDNCGARDTLVRSGVNGFVIEPDNPAGLAFFLKLIGEDEALWRRFCLATLERAEQSDAPRFAEAVRAIVASRL